MAKYILRTRTTNGKSVQYRSRVCTGKGRNGDTCMVQPLPDKAGDGRFYCHWHHPDKSKRAISRFDSRHPSNSGPDGRIPKKVVNKVVNKLKMLGVKPVEKSESILPVSWQEMQVRNPEAMGTEFASSLNHIVEEMAKKALARQLQNWLTELSK